MIEELAEMIETILKQDQLFTLGAKMFKKTVDALVAEGVSREEAIQIVARQGPMVKANR
jgi:uncharacterized protein YoaH (UPF0181 family)